MKDAFSALPSKAFNLAGSFLLALMWLSDQTMAQVPAPALQDMEAQNSPNLKGPVRVEAAATAWSQGCNATCLTRMANLYLTALSRRDFSDLPVAANLMVTENGHPSRIGNSVWRVVEKVNDPVNFYTDPVEGQVVAITTIEESGGELLIYILRLKIENQKIADVEQLVISDVDAGTHFRPDNLVENFNQATTEIVPESERMTREELLATSDSYWYDGPDALTATADCLHWQNADITVYPCATGRTRGQRGMTYGVRALRPIITDTSRNLVVHFLYEDMSPYLNPDPPDAMRTPEFFRRPLTNVAVEIHKYQKDRQIAALELFMTFQEANLPALFPRMHEVSD